MSEERIEIVVDEKVLNERLELVEGRIKEIRDMKPEDAGYGEGAFRDDKFAYMDFFKVKSAYIINMLDIYHMLKGNGLSVNDAGKSFYNAEQNRAMYEDILGDNYNVSYSNPDYAEERLGIYGGVLSFVSAELQMLPSLVFDNRLTDILSLLELFVELYCKFEAEDISLARIQEAVFYYGYDYIENIAQERMEETFTPCSGIAYDIVTNADLSDLSYLYRYGEYISENEISLAKYLNTLSEESISKVAAVFTGGFRRGFDVMRIDITGKKSVWMRYHIGQERIVREAVKQFKEMGLDTILARCAVNRLVRRGVVKQGYEATPPNRQFEYDHRNDDRFFLDHRFTDRRLNAAVNSYKKLGNAIKEFAGPAVIETFGEALFSPERKDSVPALSNKEQELSRNMYNKLGEISNKYLPGDSYSFTIIAFPTPDIGDDFEDIFNETLVLNSLDNQRYIDIQQHIIDVLDRAEVVRVVGMNGNRTDMTVQMRHLLDPDHETQFENCTADVNIPLGEVFTSPVLKGTHGILNVSSTYLNGYNFEDIELIFEDGVVKSYNCANFIEGETYGYMPDKSLLKPEEYEKILDGISRGREYIKENILFDHEFLPLGEFAIGTNTSAYTMSRKYGIQAKLPILIMEKTGPHFAVGDTCYSHAEDHAVYNPDGKEIISRENDFSLLRNTEPDKAYFNCHTDITIPYNELGRLYVINPDGSEVDIIVEGRFVLSGTEELNTAFAE